MRAAISYGVSATLHIIGWGVAFWLSERLVVEPWDQRLAAGKVITLTAVTSPLARPSPSHDQPIEIESSTQPEEHQPKDTKLQEKLLNLQRDVERSVVDVEVAVPMMLSLSEERAQEESQPEINSPQQLQLRRTQQPPAISVSTTALAFEANAQRGVEIDELPKNLPTNIPPSYPSVALQSGHEGRVILRVTVRADGTVDRLQLETSSGYQSLDDAALLAVQSWRFTPAKSKGQFTHAEILVPVRFSVRR